MITVKTIYQGELRTIMEHVRSGSTVITDAPIDNQGKGEAFSPTDLVAASLGSCMLTIMGIAAREHGFDIDGTELEITKVMADKPRRISEIQIDFHFTQDYSDKVKRILKKAAETCPVALSLHPDIKQAYRFIF